MYVIMKLLTKYREKTSSDRPDSKEIEGKTSSKTPGSKETKKKTVEITLRRPDIAALYFPKSSSSLIDREEMKMFKPKPNFFIGIQVNDVGIHKKIKSLQTKLVAKNPSLYPALVKVSTLHVTLAVTYLSNELQINHLTQKLDEWITTNKNSYFQEPLILDFTGVKTFRNVVAFIDLKDSQNYERLCDISEKLNYLLAASGLQTDKRNFTPHLTFLKLSKDYKLSKAKNKFKDDFELLKECKEHFGQQEVNELQLLSMNEPKDAFGYYKCFYKVRVSEKNLCQEDHSECCEPVPKPRVRSK